MKKIILTAIAASVLAFNAQASVITFDPAGDGSTTMHTDEIAMGIFGGGTYEVQQYFHGGAVDGTLDEGDLFTESFIYDFNSANLNGVNQDIWVPGVTPDQLTFEFNLAGYISNVTYGVGGAPVLGSPTFAADLAASSFNTVFSSTASVPGTGMTVRYEGNVIGEFDVLIGISSTPVVLGGGTNSAFALEFDFNDAWRSANTALFNNVWSHSDGSPFTMSEDFNFALALGSAGPTGNPFNIVGGSPIFVQDDGGVNDGQTYFSVEVDDKGAKLGFSVPEPTSLAILGLGLLGFAGSRRRKAK